MTSSVQLFRDKTITRLREMAPMLRARGVSHLDLFGSVARDEAHADSDVDVVIELDRPMGFEFFELEIILSDLLGVKVELSTRDGMRARVLESAKQDFLRVF